MSQTSRLQAALPAANRQVARVDIVGTGLERLHRVAHSPEPVDRPAGHRCLSDAAAGTRYHHPWAARRPRPAPSQGEPYLALSLMKSMEPTGVGSTPSQRRHVYRAVIQQVHQAYQFCHYVALRCPDYVLYWTELASKYSSKMRHLSLVLWLSSGPCSRTGFVPGRVPPRQPSRCGWPQGRPPSWREPWRSPAASS